MKIAIAGGTGFIGRHVVRQLLSAGHEVRLLVRSAHDPPAQSEIVTCRLEDALDPSVLAGCDAVVNLVGIAHARDDRVFEQVHVDVVCNLLEAARVAGVRRFVHVSVVDVPSTTGVYIETKRRGEEHVRRSELDWTIVRPSMVYGEGDVALRNVVNGVRAAAVFPVPAGDTGSLQPVDVRDVALTVERAIGGHVGAHQTIDVVGPEHLDVRALVRRVGEALDLPVHPLPIPRWLMRIAAAVMERVLPRPLLTRAQIGMLTIGLHGDMDATRRGLGCAPRQLSLDRIRAIAQQAPPVPVCARLITSAEHRAWLHPFSAFAPALLWLLPVTLALFFASSRALPNLWQSVGFANALALGAAMLAMRGAPWTTMWRPSLRRTSVALAAAICMLGAALGVVAAIRRWLPELGAGADEVYAVAWSVSPSVLPVLLVIVVLEDQLWRGAVTLPLAARLGPLKGCVLAGALFGAAHVSLGPPVLVLAAFAAGTAWSLLTVRTRSLFVTSCAHVTWDIAIIALAP
jgi:uncharacterized protein YbjT (DUF2867 family)/membrane protease YdiL (CAAX protease family)